MLERLSVIRRSGVALLKCSTLLVFFAAFHVSLFANEAVTENSDDRALKQSMATLKPTQGSEQSLNILLTALKVNLRASEENKNRVRQKALIFFDEHVRTLQRKADTDAAQAFALRMNFFRHEWGALYESDIQKRLQFPALPELTPSSGTDSARRTLNESAESEAFRSSGTSETIKLRRHLYEMLSKAKTYDELMDINDSCMNYQEIHPSCTKVIILKLIQGGFYDEVLDYSEESGEIILTFTKICPRCSGSGENVCLTCKRRSTRCKDCHGKSFQTCRTCKMTNKFCQTCSGSTNVPCTLCMGKTRVLKDQRAMNVAIKMALSEFQKALMKITAEPQSEADSQ